MPRRTNQRKPTPKKTKKSTRKVPAIAEPSLSESSEDQIITPVSNEVQFEQIPVILHRPIDALDIFIARNNGKYIDTDASDEDDGCVSFNMLNGYTQERMTKDMKAIQEELASGSLDGAIKHMYQRALATK